MNRTEFPYRIGKNAGVIQLDEIVAFKADHKYTVMVLNDAREIILGDSSVVDSLRALETEFEHLFVRAHRSALLRKDAIDFIQRDMVTRNYKAFMLGGSVFSLSRRESSTVRKVFSQSRENRVTYANQRHHEQALHC